MTSSKSYSPFGTTPPFGAFPREIVSSSSPQEAPWSRISLAPPEAWVTDDVYDATLRARDGDPITRLLWSRQVLAGSDLCFHNSAIRPETDDGAQRASQWSVEFNPRNQRLVLHWLRVVRDGERIDHLHRDRLRLAQRERLVFDGIWTLGATIEGLRPGDVLEVAFTRESVHPLRPGACEVFFVVPSLQPVGRYRLRVLADPAGAKLAWKASPDAPALRETTAADGRRCWTWEGSQRTPRDPEPNQPKSFLDSTWVQVSDLADWRMLATAAAEAWARSDDGTDLLSLPGFERPAKVNGAAVVRLIQSIQDDFHHLNTDLESGGWIPVTPGMAAHRRYGDAKDLVWMTASVLRSWGVSARPVFVSSELHEQIATLLPMSALFNHAVLEVEFDGQRRWFDLARVAQGGNFRTQAVTWFGHGLPVDANAVGLCAQSGERAHGFYHWHETFLIATRRGKSSLIEQRIRAEGWQADRLRRTRLTHGVEAFPREREHQARRRYGKMHRVGALEWRDDRERNVCELVEVFEASGLTHLDEARTQAIFDVPPSILVKQFALPADAPRRAPWALPFPLEVVHEITVRASGITSGALRHRQWAEEGFVATLDEAKNNGVATQISRLTATKPMVSVEKLPAFRKQLERFFHETNWKLTLPRGTSRPRRGAGFGTFEVQTQEGELGPPPPPPPTPLPEHEVKRAPHARRGRRRRSTLLIPSWVWPLTVICLIGVGLLFLRSFLR